MTARRKDFWKPLFLKSNKSFNWKLQNALFEEFAAYYYLHKSNVLGEVEYQGIFVLNSDICSVR